jgi:archaemetzincin
MNAPFKPIGVVPLGKISDIVSKTIAAGILGYLHLDAEVLQPRKIPENTYDQGRLQYNAGLLLEAFESIPFQYHKKVIGVMDVDLFVPILTHVYGEARQGGGFALVSVHRLKRNLDGSPVPAPLLLERASKVALHELGHLFNLVHCEDGRCLMHFSGGVNDLDNTPPYFCRYCSLYLRDELPRDGKKDPGPTLPKEN